MDVNEYGDSVTSVSKIVVLLSMANLVVFISGFDVHFVRWPNGSQYVMMNGSVNGLRYKDMILAPFVFPYAGAVGQELIQMDDNATAHRASIVTAYLEDQEIMDWPAKSLDMNPIKKAWVMLQRRVSVCPHQPSTRQELAGALRDEQCQLPQNDIKTLIDSFLIHVREGIQANR